jgi:hypothetical protein
MSTQAIYAGFPELGNSDYKSNTKEHSYLQAQGKQDTMAGKTSSS